MMAVEWLMEQITYDNGFGQRRNSYIDSFDLSEFFKQAKEMEKQQIIEFTNDFIDKHTFGDYDGIVQKNKSVEEYYNEKFNK